MPPKDLSEHRKERMTLLDTQERIARVKRVAKQNGLSGPELLRLAVNAYCDDLEEKYLARQNRMKG